MAVVQKKIAASTPELRDVYRSLLIKDVWTDTLFSKVLTLCWEIVGKQECATPDWWPVLNPNHEAGAEINPEVVQRVRHLVEVLPNEAIPSVPASVPINPKNDLMRLAESACAFFILQSLDVVGGDQGFFADAQSLLFVCCADYVLPRLKTESPVVHDCLLSAMYCHTFLAWRHHHAHMFYLQSVLMDYLGRVNERLNLLAESISLTPVTSHDFLTKVQSYWSDLIDVKAYSAAEIFLLGVHRGALRDDLEEIGEMFHSTRLAMVGVYDKR